MISDDQTGIIPVAKRICKARKIASRPIEQPKEPEDGKDKFWCYESGIVKIDEESLYNFLFKKGYRRFAAADDGFKYIVMIHNNNVDVLFCNVCELCFSIIDKEFTSVAEEERAKVKSVLKESCQTLKKKNLVKLTNVDLANFDETDSKLFLMNLSKKSKMDEGGTK